MTGHPVAVKVMTHPRWRREGRGGAFERELRALARLDHPAVVRVHDYGWIDQATADASGGQLQANGPYLVMDWYPRGTLAQLPARQPFPMLQAVLLRLLDGLAYVHARGLVHRDLKPANVLFGEHGPVLSDLGTVYTQATALAMPEGAWGTPNYMAPEQVTRDPWHLGPWTDLYALGTLAWQRVTGDIPYRRKGIAATLRARSREPLPAFIPLTSVPADFEPWLRRLLARSPAHRYRFAADAATALLALGRPAELGQLMTDAPSPSVTGDATTVDPTLSHTVITEPTVLSTLDALDTGDPIEARPTAVEPPTTPGITLMHPGRSLLGWRTFEQPSRPWLPDCGRGLARLRVPAMQGRDQERDRLWRALDETASTGQARVVCIEGGPGIGKTRLLEWFVHRAHELGRADALWVRPRRTPFQASALWWALGRRLPRQVMSPPELVEHLTEALGMDADLAKIAAHFAERAPEGEAFSERDGFAATLAALAALCAHRPLVVALDDAQLDELALRFVLQALERRPRLPVIYVVAMDREGDRLDPLVRRRLDAVLAAADGPPIALHALDPETDAAISTRRLPLDGESRQALGRIARGNPLSAQTVLQLWLDWGALDQTFNGHRISPEALAATPVDLVGAWVGRLEAAGRRLSAAQARTLELAAVLGDPVTPEHWRAVCADAGVAPPSEVIPACLDMDLLEVGPAGEVALRHPLVGAALRAQAQRGGRLTRWHTLCAEVLSGRVEVGPVAIAEHWLAAGRPAEALPSWFEAARRARTRGSIVHRRAYAIAAARCCRAMRVARHTAEWVQVKLEWTELADRTRLASASRHGRQTVEYARAGGHRALLAPALQAHAYALLHQNHFAEARQTVDDAIDLAEANGDQYCVTRCMMLQAHLASVRGELSRGWSELEACAELAEPLGDPSLLGALYNQRGELARRMGRLDLAESAYRAAQSIWSEETNWIITACNLALVQTERGLVEDARRQAEDADWRALRLGAPFLVAATGMCLVACAARTADAATWDRGWAQMEPILTLRYLDPDIGRTLELAARAAHHQLSGRSARAARVAAQVYAGLDRSEKAAAIEAWLDTTGLSTLLA